MNFLWISTIILFLFVKTPMSFFMVIMGVLFVIQRRPYQRQIKLQDIQDIKLGTALQGFTPTESMFTLIMRDRAINISPAQRISDELIERMKMDWKEELLRIRQGVDTSSDDNTQDLSDLDEQLLRDISALRLLREINQFLLNGKGRIETFHNRNNYRIIMALLWDGFIGSPQNPSLEKRNQNRIFIGVVDRKIYVNGSEVKPATTESLQQALLAKAKQIAQSEKKIVTKK